MRITAGHARSRVFRTPEGNGTRPTDARTRETLFNILGARVEGARVLDLYAGSGALGLEALSRGAASCLFVEQNAAAVRIIRENIAGLGYENQSTIWQTNVQSAIGRLLELEARGERPEASEDANETHHPSFIFQPFDVIIADPPFHRKSELPQLCRLLDKAAPLLHNETEPFSSDESDSPSATLVIQHAWKDEPHLSPHFVRINERRAGESRLSFYQFQIPT